MAKINNNFMQLTQKKAHGCDKIERRSQKGENMKNQVIEFRGNPMEVINNTFRNSNIIFNLDEASMEGIKSYSHIVERNQVPTSKVFFLLTDESISLEELNYPETYLAIATTNNEEYPYKILGKYSPRELYITRKDGENVFLQMNQSKLKLLKKNSN